MIYFTFIFRPLSSRTVQYAKLSLQLGHLLLASHQVRVRRADGTSNSVKGQTVQLGRELDLGSNVEESKVSRDQVVSYPSGLVLDFR